MSDRVTIIRRGKVIDTLNTKDTNIDELAEKMVGRKVSFSVEKKESQASIPVLEVKGLKVMDSRKLETVKGVDLKVYGGEIFGIAGVDGNGQNELVHAITGLASASTGEILLDGKEITNLTPKEVIESGVGHIPEDRHKRGLVLGYSLAENAILGSHRSIRFKKGLGLRYQKIREYCRKLIKEYDIRTSNEKVHAKSLSGGNQQKLIVAREIDRDPSLCIASQPTRGLDVGAIAFVHKKLVELRDQGKAVLLVSLELDEIMELSDRIAVMYDGRIVSIIDAKDATEKKLGILMAGGSVQDAV